MTSRTHFALSTIYLIVFVSGGFVGTVIFMVLGPWGWTWEAVWFTFPCAGSTACCGAYRRASLHAALIAVCAGGLLVLGLSLVSPLWPFLTLVLLWAGFCFGMIAGALLGSPSRPTRARRPNV